ncbi:TonB-dependent receptor [Novosphingobium album (ex Liu et al. 2023)]|uniref:TonB-dependent receptor n=1 Tax=Novosphingobium album (ex Liu et al. 2023) TaxID=3031130 RepID=A0ABT5WUB1_9SPHN|nr:TonB-dependent receptor [Novosphingobium album (ex Liu et al. 2023)]MDE8653456.1 TonB-dependent receptor [Novosphingobium album (ex Liu et al. 2023)]
MKKAAFRTSASAIGIIGLVAFSSVPALAQASADTGAQAAEDTSNDEGLIIVTAQRRSEAQVDVPITITTLNTQQLETANVQQLTDIAKITPALRFDRQSQFVQPSIRGIGTGITTAGGGSNVGIYIDGFYSPNPAAANFSLMNVDSIQVLKGPQGTLFGRNTTGGAILLQTSEPSYEPNAQAKIRYGRFNQVQAQAYSTYGLSDRVAFDIEGLFAHGDAFQRNIATGERDRSYRNWSVRLGFKADITDTVSALLRYQHNEVRDPRSELTNTFVDPDLGATAATFAPPSSYTTAKNFYAPGADHRFFASNQDIVQLTIKADLGFADLASYTQYRQENNNASEDLDHISLTLFQLGLPVINKTWTQEFLLTSKPGTPLQWTAGLFYFKNTDRYITYIDNGVGLGGDRILLGGSAAPTYSYAAFLDATYEINPQFFVTAGLRYAHDAVKNAYWNERFSTARNYVDDVSGNRVTPRVVLRYKPSERSSIYASYTKGYKAAIIDVGGSCQNAPFICGNVKPETIDAYEVGFKYDTRAFSFDTSAYYYNYKNLQVSLFREATAQIVNAASSEIYGLEAALRYKVSEAFELSMGANYNHGRYKKFVNAPIYLRCPDVAGCGSGASFFISTGTTLRDVHMQRSPDFTGNIGALYKTDLAGGELALSGNLYYTSKIFLSPSGTQFPQKAYETLSLRAQWTDPSDKYTVALWGENVTNSRFATQVQYNNYGIGSTWSEPVTYGIEVGAKF